MSEGKAPHLKPYHFKKGQSGNPGGRPKDTLKDFARKYFKQLNDKDKLIFLNSVDSEIVWRMAEGNPKQDTDVTSGGKPLPILGGITNVHTNNGDNKDITFKEEN